MNALTIVKYMAIAAIVITIFLTVTSGGRIGWDESALALVPLALLVTALSYFRQRGARPPVG